MKKTIGELLKEKGYITEKHINFALKEQKATGERLGEVLTRVGIITDFEIAKVLSEQSGIPFLDIRNINPEIKALMKIPPSLAKEKNVFPFKFNNQTLHIAIADPYDEKTINIVNLAAKTQIKLYIAPKSEIKRKIEWYYYLIQHPPEKEIAELTEKIRTNPNSEYNIEQLFHNIFVYAISQRATDLHLTPTEKSCRIYCRLDGILELAFVLPKNVHSRLITFIKIKAGMDIAEQRLPQDGRLRYEFLGEEYDIRVSTVKSIYGENMVLRILPIKATVLHLYNLGFTQKEIELLEELFNSPQGMILITGPTGSGKTTTLYSALRLIDVLERNVITAEDPVEYSFPLIRQTEIKEDIGFNFALAIKHFLRQDPDVILVGEIRDEETASMGIRAALTGHLFLSTLHTNDSISAIERLRDLGIGDSLLSSALLGITAQRLVRKICPHCKEEYQPDNKLLAKYHLPDEKSYFHGKGCSHCRYTGYLGRIAITEIFSIDETISNLLGEGATVSQLKKAALKKGFRPILESAKERILEGSTTVEEVARILG